MSFDLHVPESRSLKTKRAAIRPIVDGLRHRFRSRSPRSTTRTPGSGHDRGGGGGGERRPPAGGSRVGERFVDAAPAVELLGTDLVEFEAEPADWTGAS